MAAITINSHLALARDLTRMLDSQFKIGGFRFGLDPILGLIPGGGDVISLALSLYVIWIAVQMRIPADKLVIMLGNVTYDFFVGFIPILGDIHDFTFKANSKNLKIIQEYAPGGIFDAEEE